MSQKQTGKRKHVPQRSCVACRETLPKRNLMRLVSTPEGVRVDPSGKLPGRGAYLHDKKSCWQKALKGPLAAALRTTLHEQDLEVLRACLQSLPEERAGDGPSSSGESAGLKDEMAD